MQSLFYIIIFTSLFSGLTVSSYGNRINILKFYYIYFFFFIIALFYLLFQMYHLIITQTIIDVNTWSIISYESLSLKVSFKVDKLTIIMLFIVISISFCVCLFSVWYMKNDPNHLKFLNYLNYFMFFMILFVTGNSLLTIFIGWEGIGLFSYMLINFWNDRLNANRSAFKAIIVNKVGDSFIFLFMAFYFDIFETLDIGAGTKSNFFFFLKNGDIVLNVDALFIICISLFVAAVAKSAQFFLHIWLPDAMEGPTPVSALLHAATMVTAGAYLIIKFNWVYLFSNDILNLILIIGLLTNFISSFICMFQPDIKKVIAYSTASQMGLIFSAIGMYKPILAFFHMFNHAFFKALLFILAGVIIHLLQNKQDLRFIKNIKKEKFMIYSSVLISLLTLAGFPYLSGFYSKEVIIQTSFINMHIFSSFVTIFLLSSILTTTYYSVRLIYYACMFENNKEIYFDYDISKSTMGLDFKITKFVINFLLFFSIFIGSITSVIFSYEDLFFNSTMSKYFILEKLKDVQHLEYINAFFPIIEFFIGFLFVYFYIDLQSCFFFFNKFNFFAVNFPIKKFYFDILFFYSSQFLLATRSLGGRNDKDSNENPIIAYLKKKIKHYKKVLKFVLSKKILTAICCIQILLNIMFAIAFPKYYFIAVILSPLWWWLDKITKKPWDDFIKKTELYFSVVKNRKLEKIRKNKKKILDLFVSLKGKINKKSKKTGKSKKK